jgi:hypothetical protein
LINVVPLSTHRVNPTIIDCPTNPRDTWRDIIIERSAQQSVGLIRECSQNFD